MKLKYLETINAILAKEEELRKLRQNLSSHLGTHFIRAVEHHLEMDLFDMTAPAELLAKELLNRDEPFSEGDIQAIFDFSGYEYKREHILMAKPDSLDVIAEQARYYRE